MMIEFSGSVSQEPFHGNNFASYFVFFLSKRPTKLLLKGICLHRPYEHGEFVCLHRPWRWRSETSSRGGSAAATSFPSGPFQRVGNRSAARSYRQFRSLPPGSLLRRLSSWRRAPSLLLSSGSISSWTSGRCSPAKLCNNQFTKIWSSKIAYNEVLKIETFSSSYDIILLAWNFSFQQFSLKRLINRCHLDIFHGIF